MYVPCRVSSLSILPRSASGVVNIHTSSSGSTQASRQIITVPRRKLSHAKFLAPRKPVSRLIIAVPRYAILLINPTEDTDPPAPDVSWQALQSRNCSLPRHGPSRRLFYQPSPTIRSGPRSQQTHWHLSWFDAQPLLSIPLLVQPITMSIRRHVHPSPPSTFCILLSSGHGRVSHRPTLCYVKLSTFDTSI